MNARRARAIRRFVYGIAQAAPHERSYRLADATIRRDPPHRVYKRLKRRWIRDRFRSLTEGA